MGDSDLVLIRPYSGEDGPDCCRIWVAGLEQTYEGSNFIMRSLWSNLFASLAAKVTSPDGDFGQEGANIERNYIGSYTDRIMFVAVVKPSSPTTTTAAASPDQVSGRVVGCLCVKRGTVEDVSIVAPESDTVYSVNRVSVDSTARKLKIGTKLMNAAEEWARARGATKMQLTTANEIASKFYVKLNYQKIGFWGVVHEKYISSREESATSSATVSAVGGGGGGGGGGGDSN